MENRRFHSSEDRSENKRKRIQEDIEPETSKKSDEKKRRSDEEIKCLICLDTVCSSIMKSLPCAHVFHETCVDTWLAISLICPVCRFPSTIVIDDSLFTDASWLRDLSRNDDEDEPGNESDEDELGNEVVPGPNVAIRNQINDFFDGDEEELDDDIVAEYLWNFMIQNHSSNSDASK